MRLVTKLALALVPVVASVMAFETYARNTRAIESFEADMRRDHMAIGRSLLASLDHVWREEGEERALALLDEANTRVPHVHAKWVWFNDLPEEVRAQLGKTGEMSFAEREPPASYITYLAARQVPSGRSGALELREALDDEEEFARSTVVRNVRAAMAVVALHALATWGMGLVMVQRPVKAMIEKSRRIAAGDFSQPLDVRRADELSDLASAMNEMCTRLETEIAAREKVQSQLRHADRLTTVGRLASGVAHELGTPLNVVSARAKMIASGRAQQEVAQENAKIIGAQCERMTRIIRGLLDFARIKAGSKRGPVDLAAIGRDACTLFEPIASKRSVIIERPAPDASLIVEADAMQLEQVVSNLLHNAIQAVSAGGHVEVGVRAPPQAGEAACLYVKDDGPGIPPEVLPHVFEPFFTTKGVGEGTGLGLSVAHGIVAEHGGRIEVDTEAGKGARFSVYLASVQT